MAKSRIYQEKEFDLDEPDGLRYYHHDLRK